jgi:hypothetical protein
MMLKRAAFVAVVALAVWALWVFFRPQAPASAKPAATETVFELVLAQGRLVSGPAVLRVHQGDKLTVRVSSDTADELHLHGYDLHARVSPEAAAVLQFTADRTGRFGLELHKAHRELGALEVYPQ